MRIGLYGGSFNPPHLGHLYVAEEVKRILRLDEVVMIPAGDPYLKDKNTIANKDSRFEMVSLLTLSSDRNIGYASVEVKHDGPSYTIDTLKQYHKWYPDAEFYVIVGSDSFYQMDKWKEPEEILKMCTLVVVGRELNPYATYVDADRRIVEAGETWWRKYEDSIIFLDIQTLNVSSTGIRNRIQMGLPWHHLTTESVAKYIEDNGLYKEKTNV